MNPTLRPQSNYTDPAQPIERNTMPREVAIAMLTAPLAKLTNKQRKRCKAALAKIFVSPVPLIRKREPSGLGYKDPNDRTLHIGVGCTDAQREFNAERKLAGNTMRQLLRWMRRYVTRRADVQTEYLKLQDVPEGETSAQRRIRVYRCSVLEAVAAALDAHHDALHDEFDRRLARVRAQELLDNNPMAAFGV